MYDLFVSAVHFAGLAISLYGLNVVQFVVFGVGIYLGNRAYGSVIACEQNAHRLIEISSDNESVRKDAIYFVVFVVGMFAGMVCFVADLYGIVGSLIVAFAVGLPIGFAVCAMRNNKAAKVA